MDKTWVLWWKYDDGSGQEIVRTYEEEARAREDLELVEHNSESKDYMLDEIPYIKEKAKNEINPQPEPQPVVSDCTYRKFGFTKKDFTNFLIGVRFLTIKETITRWSLNQQNFLSFEIEEKP
ncbi:hypothetical protein KAU11_03850 [Candidatus Babeliales bacterium]|nr:hypothetical protein [Candidatus Babeliales bacterium]